MAYFFKGDDATPNNAALPLLLYSRVLKARETADPAAWFERRFEANGWCDGWRNGIHPYLHFHTLTHEVLGVAAGHASVEFGGKSGRVLDVTAGDVVALPAGTGHRCVAGSADLLVIGAYPGNGRFNQRRPGEIAMDTARREVAGVPLPGRDPVYGAAGPLCSLWR
jgi:uncharacterized protein YjlB